MASYDVAVWLRSESSWPSIVLTMHAETAAEAVGLILRTRRVRSAVKVAVNVGDGFLHRWYRVKTLVEGFDAQYETCLPIGVPGGKL